MPSATEELGKAIGKNIRDTEDQNQSLTNPAGEDTAIVFPTNNIQFRQIAIKISTRQIGTAMVWGHSTNGIYGTSAWGAGTMGSFTKSRVLSPNNTFWEYFASTNFKDTTNSTSTTNTTNEEESFTNGQVYQSDCIFDNNTSITSVTPEIFIRSASATVSINTSLPAQEVSLYCED